LDDSFKASSARIPGWSLDQGQINMTKEDLVEVKLALALSVIEEKERELAEVQSQLIGAEAKTERTAEQLDSMTRTNTELHQMADNHTATAQGQHIGQHADV